jgi:hypothetical protein
MILFAVGGGTALNDKRQIDATFYGQQQRGGGGLHAREGLDAFEVMTLCASKPVSTLRRPTKVRIIKAAPISSTRASAISETTGKPRKRFWRRPVPPRLWALLEGN